jgi:hypothetical protein
MVVNRIVLCFFINTDSGILKFFTTPWLSQKKFTGPAIGTPNIHSLYRKATIKSLHIAPCCNEFAPKRRAFHSILSFREPNNQSILHKDKDSTLGLLCHDIASMVSINKSRDSYRFFPWFGHVWRKFLLNFAIETCPVCIAIENSFVHNQFLWIIS